MTKLSKDQIEKNRQHRLFKNKIRTIFVTAGFEYINTTNKHVKIGNRTVEIDAIFIYENILLVCEDTTATTHHKDHIRTKNESFNEIKENFSDFYKWLLETFPDDNKIIDQYSEKRYRVFFLYISQNELNLTTDDLLLYPSIKFIEPQTLNYFHKMSQSIKRTVRYDIFRYLDISADEIGLVSSESGRKIIKAPIICPNDTTGLKNGIRIVSFMMSADSLLGTCYVLRKDNWESSIQLYQRLIEVKKIKGIREFLATKGEAFFNNIIVGLPDDVRFTNAVGEPITIDQVGDFGNCQMEIPNKTNSICVIDGQHRIYAHFEGLDNDKHEVKIAQLRKKLHLLVTGLIFPPDMKEIDRAQIQSQIFLDINSNAKPVPADVILHIQMVKDPFSDIGLARQVIEMLNKENIFFKMFELSLLGNSKIKVASIIKFALRYLVKTEDMDGRASLYEYWNGDKDAFLNKDKKALAEYIRFCVTNLSMYFSAVKNNYSEQWNDKTSKILSVTSINGFIIAYGRQLPKNGIREYGFFDKCFKHLRVDFSKANFPYISSRYRKFSKQILSQAFGIIDESANDLSSEVHLSIPEGAVSVSATDISGFEITFENKNSKSNE